MAQSKHTAAHFTFVEECDATALKDLRARLKPVAEAQGAKLSFLPFIVKAVVLALKRHPILNATLDEAANERHSQRISPRASRVSAWVIPTDEELMIARHTRSLIHV